jgi:hypothetical protein
MTFDVGPPPWDTIKKMNKNASSRDPGDIYSRVMKDPQGYASLLLGRARTQDLNDLPVPQFIAKALIPKIQKNLPHYVEKLKSIDPDRAKRFIERNPQLFEGVSINLPDLSKHAVVKREKNKYVLYTKDGKRVLGRHDTAQGAYKQEYAIQKSKEKAASVMEKLSEADYKLIFYENRSTPQVIRPDRSEDARPKKGFGPIVSSRTASPGEVKKIEQGKWVRVDEHGRTHKEKNYKKSKYRSWLYKEKAASEDSDNGSLKKQDLQHIGLFMNHEFRSGVPIQDKKKEIRDAIMSAIRSLAPQIKPELLNKGQN